MASIYLIKSPDGKKYIGSTKQSVLRRLQTHRASANFGIPCKLYDAMRALGPHNFTIEELFVCEVEDRYTLEGEQIRHFNSHIDGLNKNMAGRTQADNIRAWRAEKARLAAEAPPPAPEPLN